MLALDEQQESRGAPGWRPWAAVTSPRRRFPLAVAVVIGAATAVIAVGTALRYQYSRREAGTLHPVLFASDAP
jgi:hypothetical protein